MIGNLVVHLGDTKTGSTSIQRVLVRQTYDIGADRICYPTESHHIAMAKTLTRKHRMGQQRQRFTRVCRDLSKSNAEYGIVSAEHFQFVDPEVFADAISKYWRGMDKRMRLVAYVRPHPDKLVSSFSERVKLGVSRGSFRQFLDQVDANGSLEYTPRFLKWRQVFGDRFVLRPFVRSELFQGDAVADFFRFVLGREDFKLTGPTSENTSLTVPQLALLRLIQRIFAQKLELHDKKRSPRLKEARGALGRVSSEHIRVSRLGDGGEKFRLPADLADRIHDRYLRDARMLDREFFDGTPMTDGLDAITKKTTTENQSLIASDHFGPEVVESVSVFAGILSEMAIDQPAKFQKLASKARLVSR
jgi:hypothetical protein